MKKYLFILLAALTFVACSEDDELQEGNTSNANVENISVIEDARFMKSMYAYVMDDKDFHVFKYNPYYYKHKYIYSKPNDPTQLEQYLDSMERVIGKHEPMNYENMRLLIHEDVYDAFEPEENEMVTSDYLTFVNEVSEKIAIPKEQYRDWNGFMSENIFSRRYCDAGRNGAAHFLTARFCDDVTITANQTLFGLEPGTDLSQHFAVEAPALCLPQGSPKDFKFVYWYTDTSITTDVREYFASETWLQCSYVFWLRDVPNEQHESVTFTIKLPVDCEYWWDYYNCNNHELKTEKMILSQTCTVHFGKPSDFEQYYKESVALDKRLWWE